MFAPLVDSFELESLCAAVLAEDRQADLTEAVLRSGCESVVVETAEWIYRFPRREEIAFDRELHILARIDGRLPAATPSVEWIGEKTRFAAYRKLVGVEFDPIAYCAATEGERDALGRSLAEFLVAIHDSFDAAEIERLGIPALHDEPIDLDALPTEMRTLAAGTLAEHHRRWAIDGVPGPDVVLHNDFHVHNMVLAGPIGPVVGVWDFSCVAVGRPTFDLRYFETDSIDLLRRIANAYERISGRSIDVAAAISANHKEIIGDAIETGDTTDLLKAIERGGA